MKNRPLCSICLFLFLVICTVILAGKEKVIRELRSSPAESSLPDGEEILLAGRVYKKENRDNHQILYLKNNSIKYQEQFIKESRIIIYDEGKTEVHIGQGIRVRGKLSFYEPAHNPGNFDQKLYYQKQDIHASLWADEVKAADEERNVALDSLYRLRQSFVKVFEENMQKEDADVLAAMILGEKGGMDAELRELYQVSGISHLLAVSGLHISFIGVGLYKILRRITGSYPVGGAAGILFLILYILMIGFTISAVRALVMFLFRVGADIAGRHYDAPTAFAAAAVITVIWRPLCLYDGGFWLSFGAVFAIMTVTPVMQAQMKSIEKENKGTGALEYIRRCCVWICQGLAAGVSIHSVILPVLLYYFFELSLYSFLLNLFVIPLMSVLLFLGISGTFLGMWAAAPAGLLFKLCSRILWIYKESCNTAIGLPGARIVTGKPEMWQIAVYYGIFVFALYLLRSSQDSQKHQEDRNCQAPRHRCKKLTALLLWMVGLSVMVFRWGESGKLTTVVLDVGQGDGIFMRGPDGGTYLIDGGSSDVKKVGQYRLESFLKSQGVGTLDYVLISHGDSDHMNGVEELIERQDIGVKIKTLVLPAQEVWDEALSGLAEKASDFGIRVVTMETDQSIREGEMTLTCIQPGNMEKEATDDTELQSGNAASMVLAVQYGEFDMLLTGDVEGEGEEQLTKRLEEQYQNYVWEVLKVAHHGSKNSSAEEFLKQVQPAYALISAGKENRYGHPHQETIERLVDAGSKIYSTQDNGAIIIEVKGGRTLKIEKN